MPRDGLPKHGVTEWRDRPFSYAACSRDFPGAQGETIVEHR